MEIYECPHGQHPGDCMYCNHDTNRIMAELARIMPQDKSKTYFITFTKNGEVKLDKWQARVIFELRRAHVKDIYAAVEHKDDNIHVHVKMLSKVDLKKQMFSTFTKHYGFVDIMRVNKDNGIAQYLNKENDATSDPDTLFVAAESKDEVD